jgi:hypothetical protein
MLFASRAVHQIGVALNEALRHLGYQVLKSEQVDELKFFVIPGIAGMMRLPEVFVETGTYLGNTTAMAARYFREVHTIELQDDLYKRAQERFRGTPNVNCHLGNSSEVLRDLATFIDEPALFFLDAHWSGGVTAHGKVEVPLLEELEILRRRNHDDFIIVDDARLIGKAGKTGLHLSREYPVTPFDWRNVTMEAIRNRLPSDVTMKECADKLLIDTKTARGHSSECQAATVSQASARKTLVSANVS